ncbi:tyrosine-protein phosphatase [Qipengyuania sp. JC766]|uniref:tyrosine-protein phosphatase n=1 Tax=Qipengyuania sp. JC766 TaxID=3232139 RepID=UPI00345840C3
MIRSNAVSAFLPTEGIHNFRDFGGYRGADGAMVRRDLLFRSGQHVGASDADLAAIAALDIRTVIDLRGNAERERNPCRRVEGFVGEVVFYDGETSSSPPHEDLGDTAVDADYARRRMTQVYKRMARNPAMIEMFGRYFRVLAEREGASLVHCFAGKDRTGVAATLVLHVLGVGRDDQMAEFLLTNLAPTVDVLKSQSLPGIEARLGKLDEETIRNLMEVREEYLATFTREVEADFGSIDGFVERALGVDRELADTLRQRYLA